jgi:photosystem II stability/assembly factor-like uncharacterized protein
MIRDFIHRKAIIVFALILASGALLQAQQYNEALFKGMQYRLIGPYRGGRVEAVAGLPDNPKVYYFGAVAGGVWKTVNGGATWEPLFDKQPQVGIGAIAIAPSDPNVIYVGTGEVCLRGDISFGDGVYKSTDGGKTWTNVGLKDSQHIGAIVVNPDDPNIVFVAALGHAFGPNEERGVFRSTDGGKTWNKVLYKDDKSGAVDIVYDPNNSHILFATLWQAQRTPYSLISGGPGSGLYRSTDGGSTWKLLEGHGLPKGIMGRIGVSVSGADSSRVYAQIESKEGGLFRSDNGGDTWTKINSDDRFRQRAWYYSHVFADPKNVDTVYELNVGFFRSTDGGKTFLGVEQPHGDNHALWIDPNDPQRMINGNDGGATITLDCGKTWSAQNNQPTSAFYHAITDNRFPYYVYGAQQDNSSVGIKSASDEGAITWKDWYDVGDEESGWLAPYPPDPNIVYDDGYEGEVTRYDHRTGQEQQISPWPEVSDAEGAANLKYRFQWTAPLIISPHDPNTLYLGGNVLFKSTDGGMVWTPISPDLTHNDKSKQQPSGGPITIDDTGAEYYDTIFVIAESPLQKGLIWVGSDDGLIHVTHNGGTSWDDATPKQMPEWGLVSMIDPSTRVARAAYLSVDRHKSDDYKPYIYKTKDFGKTWTEITHGIPEGTYVHVVREDPKRAGLLFAGTETGMYVSFDDGAQWQPLQLNLPHAPVYDLVVKGDDLVLATHGRSFWILDDISPLREVNAAAADSSVYLYKPAVALRTHLGHEEHPIVAGENPPAGAVIDYYLKAEPPKGEAVTLEILDGKGEVVRSYSSLKPIAYTEPGEGGLQAEPKPPKTLPAKAGMNRFVWDLHYNQASSVPGLYVWDWKAGIQGPLALPGTYQVKLTAEGKTLTAPLEVNMDPRVKTTKADLEKEFALFGQIHERLNQVDDTINQIQSVHSQLEGLEKRLGDEPSNKDLVAAAKKLDESAIEVRDSLVDVKVVTDEDSLAFPLKIREKLAALASNLMIADTAPAKGFYDVFDELNKQAADALAKWKEVSSKDLSALNDMAQKQGVGIVMVIPPKQED